MTTHTEAVTARVHAERKKWAMLVDGLSRHVPGRNFAWVEAFGFGFRKTQKKQ